MPDSNTARVNYFLFALSSNYDRRFERLKRTATEGAKDRRRRAVRHWTPAER